MKYSEYFRKLARRCRVLSKTAVDLELIEQTRVWAVDFADEADEAERRSNGRHRYLTTRSGSRTTGLAGHDPHGSTRPAKAEMTESGAGTAEHHHARTLVGKWGRQSG
jgi:hypothetical protein